MKKIDKAMETEIKITKEQVLKWRCPMQYGMTCIGDCNGDSDICEIEWNKEVTNDSN
jgi:hypothetical protein